MENQFLRSYNLLSTSIAGANNIQQLPPTAITNAFSSPTMSPLQQLLTAAFAAAAAAATVNVTTTNFDSLLPVMVLPCSATDQPKMQPTRPLLGEDSNVPQEKLDNDANFSPQDFFHKKTFNERNFRTAPNNTLAFDGGLESMPLQQTLRTTSSNSSNGSSCGGFAGNCNSINKASCPLENCRQMLALFAPPQPPPLPHFAVDRLPTSQPSLNASSNGIKFSIDRILRSSHGQPQTVGSENNRFFPFRPPSISNNFGQFSSSVNDVMTERNKANKPYSSNFVKLEQQPASGNEFQDNEPSHHTNNNGKRLRNKSDSEEIETKAKAACRRRSVGKFVDGGCEKKTPKTEPLLPNENTIWPAWVYCTRYSDRPSSVGKTGPRIRKQRNNTKKKSSLAADTAKIAMTNDGDCDGAAAAGDDKRPRTAFTQHQLDRLKTEFHVHRYLTEQKRQQLAGELNLNESQIKIWFQNKRAKLKKATGVKNKLAQQLISQGLYNHSTMSLPMTDDDDDDDEDLDCKAEVQEEIQVDDGVRTGSSNEIFDPSENSA